MSAKVRHIHLPHTTYVLCKKDGGVNSDKTHATCKTCLKLYKHHKEMIKELSEFKGGMNAHHILAKYNFI